MKTEQEFDERFLAARMYLFNTLRRKFGSWNQEDILDLVHDTYLRCRPKFAGLRDRACFKTWLVSCAFNIAFQKHRKRESARRGQMKIMLAAPLEESRRRAKTDPLDIFLVEERGAMLAAELEDCSGPVLETLLLRFWHGLGFSEIAKVQEINEQTAKSRVHRVIVQLRAKLAA